MAMKIGELARQAGLAPSALRFYEGAGLLPPARRTEVGYRLYDRVALGRLGFIQRAQALGLSVREIKELVDAPVSDNESERARLRHAIAHKLADAERRLAELEGLRGELERLYVRMSRPNPGACGHLGDCACWLPTEREVMNMASDVKSIRDCGCCDCPEPGCECDCDCCGGA